MSGDEEDGPGESWAGGVVEEAGEDHQPRLKQLPDGPAAASQCVVSQYPVQDPHYAPRVRTLGAGRAVEQAGECLSSFRQLGAIVA